MIHDKLQRHYSRPTDYGIIDGYFCDFSHLNHHAMIHGKLQRHYSRPTDYGIIDQTERGLISIQCNRNHNQTATAYLDLLSSHLTN